MPTSPFAERLQRDWMWRQNPPITSANGLAKAIGISVSAANNYLNKGTTPEFIALVDIAHKTGLPLGAMMRDCGYEVPNDITEDFAQRLSSRFSEKTAYTRDEAIAIVKQTEAEFFNHQP